MPWTSRRDRAKEIAVERRAQRVIRLSGIEIALWDLLGKRRGEPVWSLLGYRRAFPRRPYASVFFGATAEGTFAKARALRAAGHDAAKFGWGRYGASTVEDDEALVRPASPNAGPCPAFRGRGHRPGIVGRRLQSALVATGRNISFGIL